MHFYVPVHSEALLVAEMARIVFFFFLLLFISLSLGEFASNGWKQVNLQLSYNAMKNINLETHNTKLFRHQSGLYVRHNLDFHVILKHTHQQLCDEPFQFKLIENNISVHKWIQKPQTVQHNSHDHEEILEFNLHVSRSIPIGQYTLSVDDPCSEPTQKELQLCYVNVMFNPWPETITELKAESLERVQRQAPNIDLSEYVNNSFGFIWIGGRVAIPWNYGVNSQVVTEAKNALTQMMSQAERSDPVLYSRTLTELIGRDVLYGRWDGSYNDGVEPTQWVGSEDILKRWLQTKSPVRYAQCWVFAAILTTILRASGIPARTVTNYGSHHDRGLTDNGTAVLRQYDNIVQPDETTWNFHVWSEAWMKRPDLGQPVGWNAVDATPQEPSPLAPGQPYRAGPAYVPFIRADMRNVDYDTYFILAEVNAVKYCPMTGKPLSQSVGFAVLTKKPGTGRDVYNYNNAENITINYKISTPPISRKDLRSPSDDSTLPSPFARCELDDGMRLDSTPVHPRVGENFLLTVTEGNVSVANEDIVIQVELMNYMGESLGVIATYSGIKELNVTESDYLAYLGNSSVFRFSVGTLNESGSLVFHSTLLITLGYEPLIVEATRDTNSTTISLVLTYTNPLSAPMTGVIVSVSSPDNTYIREERPDIPANTRFTSMVEVQCYEDDDGDAMIPVSLDSDVTQSVYGIGWSSCRDTPSNGGIVMLSVLSGMQMMLLSLLSLYLSV